MNRSFVVAIAILLSAVGGFASCTTEHVVGAVPITRACMSFPRIASIRIDVVSDEPDTRTPRLHASECLDVPDTLIATTPMQVMLGLNARGYIVDGVSEDSHARVKIVGFAEIGCPSSVPTDAFAFCALSTRALEDDLEDEGNTLFIDFFCSDGGTTRQITECRLFGVE